MLCKVVFDGYASGPSTKDITHIRRKRGIVSTSVRFTNDTPFRSNKDTFLNNIENKQNLIYFLGDYLSERGICVRHAESDADVLIVNTAIAYAETTTTFVIGEDKDLLILLCYNAMENTKKIFFRSDRTKSKPNNVWDIHKTQSLLTKAICELLPFLHALTGWDTTSRIYGVSKAKLFDVTVKYIVTVNGVHVGSMV